VTAVSKLVAPLVAAVVLGLVPPSARAGVPGRAAREAAEAALRLLGREAETEGTDALARKIEQLAMRHGDEVLTAAREGGPEAVRLIEAAGVHGEPAARVLAQHGPEAARIVVRPALMELVERHGDDAVRALLRHPGLAEPVVGALGKPGARALAAIGPRNARRLAILVEDGALARSGRWGELLAVIERHGDVALSFVWRHKGALAVSTILAKFLAEPEVFLGGGRELIGGAAQEATQPIALVAGTAAGRWMNIARSVVVVGLAWLVLVPVLVASARFLRQIHRRSYR
jgi:hypothetical protein